MKIPRDLLVLLIVYGGFSFLPAFLSNNLSVMNLLIMIMLWGIVASHWDLIMAYAGVLTFGSIAFYAIGAYASAILSIRFGISPWLGILAGGGTAAGIGVLLSLPCLRLKPAYIALLTFAFHMILTPFIRSDLGAAIGTGGALMLTGIPPLSVVGYTFSRLELVPWFYVTLGISLASLFAIYKVIHSPWGLAFTALRDSDALAKSAGIDDFRYKAVVFGITSFFMGVAGALYAHFMGVLSTVILTLDMMCLLMLSQIVGGRASFPGAVLGVIVVLVANYLLRATGTYRMVILGATLVTIVIFAPRGIMGAIAGGVGPPGRFKRFARWSFERRFSKEK